MIDMPRVELVDVAERLMASSGNRICPPSLTWRKWGRRAPWKRVR